MVPRFIYTYKVIYLCNIHHVYYQIYDMKVEMKMSGETKKMKGIAGRMGKEEEYGGCAQCVWKPRAH